MKTPDDYVVSVMLSLLENWYGLNDLEKIDSLSHKIKDLETARTMIIKSYLESIRRKKK